MTVNTNGPASLVGTEAPPTPNLDNPAAGPSARISATHVMKTVRFELTGYPPMRRKESNDRFVPARVRIELRGDVDHLVVQYVAIGGVQTGSDYTAHVSDVYDGNAYTDLPAGFVRLIVAAREV